MFLRPNLLRTVIVVLGLGGALMGALVPLAGDDFQLATPPPPDMRTLFPFSEVKNPLPPIDPRDIQLSTGVEIVLLDVSVKNPAGGFVSGLAKENFQVFDNNKPQKINSFEAGDIPVTLGLVIDASGSMRPKRSEVVTAALAFVQASNPKDELFTVNFNDRVYMGLPQGMDFTDDRQVLRNGLLATPVQGRTALNDALKIALEHLNKGRQQKKTLVLISDGGDNASQLTESETYKLAQASPATIYTVGLYDEFDKDKNPGFLRKLASVTGGEFYEPQKLDQLVDICVKIAKDIRNRYTIGYMPEQDHEVPLHKIRAVASAPDKGKLLVRTRTQYLDIHEAPGAPKTATKTRTKR